MPYLRNVYVPEAERQAFIADIEALPLHVFNEAQALAPDMDSKLLQEAIAELMGDAFDITL